MDRDEEGQKELNQHLRSVMQSIGARIDEISEYLGVIDESYETLEFAERIEKLFSGFRIREEELIRRYEEALMSSSKDENNENELDVSEIVRNNRELEVSYLRS